MRRRVFITGCAGAAVLPLGAKAQERARLQRIGVILPAGADDAEFQSFFGAFLQALGQLGWSIGSNVRVDVRWATANPASIRKHVEELVALAPDVILAHGGATISPIHQATRTIPIVFTVISDPVASGFADSLARPGGNMTGFANAEWSMAGKWLQMLNQIAPRVTRVAILRDPSLPSGLGQFAAIQTAAVPLGIEISALNLRSTTEIESGLTAFARLPNGGVIVASSGLAAQQRSVIISLIERHKLPAMYFNNIFAKAGGLASYGVDFIDQYRRAAGYVDRILKGERAGELPIQAPVKFQMVINMKTAKALGITIPTSLLASADEVIE